MELPILKKVKIANALQSYIYAKLNTVKTRYFNIYAELSMSDIDDKFKSGKGANKLKAHAQADINRHF